MLGFLTDNLAIVALLALTLLVLIVLGLVVWAAAQGADSEERKKSAARASARQMNLDSLKQSFRRAVELIEANLAARSERYKLSWTLVLNEDESGRELPLLASGIPSALSTDSALSAQGQGITWNFFDQGVAIQLQGAYLGDPEEAGSAGNKVWDEFLGLCRGYRPDRPFDSVVLALPAHLLLPGDPQAELELAARAKSIHRRLWLAQNRFALQFPISLVITGCERIPGFTAFALALPETLRRSMLGWSSPYELSAPFQGQWIDTGMDEVARDVQDACAELCALELAGQDSADYFMLPAELERLRRGLKLFAEELMRPSAYHEPFLLRGFYLSGDCSPAAELAAAAPQPEGDEPFALLDASGKPLEPLQAGFSANVASGVGLAMGDRLDRDPAFLRDVFEKKVFAESGLVRASRVQQLRRPALGRALGWSLAAVPVVWAVGLLLAGLRLHAVSTDIEYALRQLDRDSRAALSAEPADPVQLRARAVATLALMEQIDAGLFRSVFMPGSWHIFDDMHERLAMRLERGFTTHSVEPLRLGAYARISELTGVPTDPSTGTLIAGATCALPAGFSAQAHQATSSGGLNPEDLPEFTALLQFASRIEELDRATQAMQRLAQGPQIPQGEDLKLVVRTYLGAELSGNFSRAAHLFRLQARNAAPLSIGPMQQATGCAFNALAKALRERMFEGNELLAAEQNLVAQVQLRESAGDDWQTAQQGWNEVLEGMRQEESLMQAGKGAWMQRRTLVPGQAWDTLMQRMLANGLVGREPVAALQKAAEEDFGRFLGQWDAALSEGGGLVWSEKESRWSFTQERADLRAGLNALMAMPAMKPGRRKLPDIPMGASVGWDRAKLDQALALADGRKKFEVDVLPKLPASAKDAVDAMVRGALADGVVDMLAQAVMVSSRGGQVPVVAEPERTRVVRARLLLDELGARASADRLGLLLTRDALARLRVLDDTLRQSDVYLPREMDFRSWNGEKSPMTGAFAVGDAAGLALYAAQQQGFVEGLAKEAEVLLQVFGDTTTEPLALRWRAIATDLNRYRLKSPASSLAMLEQFVVTGAAELDLGNCGDKLRPPQRRVGDFFAERLASLQAGLAGRCRELRAAESQDGWNRMAEAFNRELSGRAPFKTATGPERPPAEVDEVLSVMRSFERVHKLMGERAAVSPAVRRFDEQMERVRVFMAPLAPAEEGAASGYDVAVEFRANLPAEIEGNKIIDWTVSIGSQTLRWREAPKPLRWEPGQPVLVSLRVARDGPVSPRADAGQAAMTVDERTVNFRFRDPWALYSLIAGQREADVPGRSDARSQLLRFEFPLVTASPDGGKTPPTESKARVFLRLTVSPAGKRAPLAWPATFPTRAPEWGGP